MARYAVGIGLALMLALVFWRSRNSQPEKVSREPAAKQAAMPAAKQPAVRKAAKTQDPAAKAAQEAAEKAAAQKAAEAQASAAKAAQEAAEKAAAQKAAEAAADMQVTTHTVVAPQGTTQGQKNWAQCCADAGGAWRWGPESGDCWNDPSCQAKWGCCIDANYNDKVPSCHLARKDHGHFRGRFRCLSH